MAARFLLAAAGVLLVVAMAEATTKTVFTTTTVEENENPTGRRTEMPCSQQMSEQQMLNHCMMYLDTSSGMSKSRGRMSDPEQHLELCCMQLENMDEMCRCDAIKMMMNQQGSWTPQRMGRIMGMAQTLPKKCSLEPQMCQMRAVWF